jgi:hypothetical protein
MKIVTYHLEDCGIDHAQYFTGRGVSFTSWDYCFVGAGSTPHEAAEDAIDQLGYSDLSVDLDSIKNTLRKRIDSRLLHFEDCPRSKRYNAECTGCDELYCYAALYIKTE